MTDNELLSASFAYAKSQVEQYTENVDPSLDQRDEGLRHELAHQNASAKVKLRRIYMLQKDISEAVAPYVACGDQCSACCKMNVDITAVEAQRIAEASGRKAATLGRSIRHPTRKFSGVACPFLKDERCSVYDARPLACRKHHSFDSSSYWCQPERSDVLLPMVSYSGIALAYAELVQRSVHGDIRDFFPE